MNKNKNKNEPEDLTSYATPDVSELTGLEDAIADHEAPAKKEEVGSGFFGRIVRLFSSDDPDRQEEGRELRRAVRAQDVESVRDMISKGYGVNQVQEASLACIACRRANLEMLNLLVEAGVDVKTPDRRSQTSKARTPLQEAARKGWAEGMEVLLGLGVDVDACEEGDVTALHIAARMGHEEAVRLLLKNRADPCGSRLSITSPIHETPSLNVAKMLLAAGAMIDLRDKNKCTPLHLQAYSGHSGIVELLLENGADPSACDRKARTPVFLIGGRGDTLRCYDLFKKKKINYNLRDLNENSIAHSIAHRSNNEELLLILLSDAPSLWQTKNASGQTPLDILVFRNQGAWARRLKSRMETAA